MVMDGFGCHTCLSLMLLWHWRKRVAWVSIVVDSVAQHAHPPHRSTLWSHTTSMDLFFSIQFHCSSIPTGPDHLYQSRARHLFQSRRLAPLSMTTASRLPRQAVETLRAIPILQAVHGHMVIVDSWRCHRRRRRRRRRRNRILNINATLMGEVPEVTVRRPAIPTSFRLEKSQQSSIPRYCPEDHHKTTLGLGPPSQVGRAGSRLVTWEFQGIPGAMREKDMGDDGPHWAVPFFLGLACD